jgi:hypothetical protein
MKPVQGSRPQSFATATTRAGAPPVYRPQAGLPLQGKMTARPVYRPQTGLPLQSKMATPRVFRPAVGGVPRAEGRQVPTVQGAAVQGRMGGAPPVYRPGADPVQRKRTVVGVQATPPAALVRPSLVQAKVQLKHGPIIGPSITSAAAKKLLDKLEDDLGCTKFGSRYKRAKDLIGDPKTFEFEGFKHFSDFVHDPDDIEPPSIKVDDDLAEAVDDWAMDLGEEFKGQRFLFRGRGSLRLRTPRAR